MRAYPKTNNQCSPAEYARRRARWLLKDAVRYGKINRGTSCEFEGGDCDGPIQAHHDDYSKPYDVRWICRLHHARVDASKHQRGGWNDATLRAHWLAKARRYDEATAAKGNRKAIDMHRPNPRYDSMEPTV